MAQRDFPGGPMVKNPPASAGDTGLIPVQEDSTCLGATWSVCCNYWSLRSRAHAVPQEKPPQVENNPWLATTRESLLVAMKTQHSQINRYSLKNKRNGSEIIKKLCNVSYWNYRKFKFMKLLHSDRYPHCSKERMSVVLSQCSAVSCLGTFWMTEPGKDLDSLLIGVNINTCLFTHQLLLHRLAEGLPYSLGWTPA